MLRGLISLFALIAIIFSGCNRISLADPQATGKRYMPLREGKWWIYAVSSSPGNDTTTSQVKYTVTGAQSVAPDSLYIVGEYLRDTEGNWKQSRSLSVRVNETQLFLNDENIVTLELVFPVVNGKTWFRYPNTDQELNEFPLEMSGIGQSYDQWSNTLTVSSVSQLGPQITNVYAENIGLVFALNETEYEKWELEDYGVE